MHFLRKKEDRSGLPFVCNYFRRLVPCAKMQSSVTLHPSRGFRKLVPCAKTQSYEQDKKD